MSVNEIIIGLIILPPFIGSVFSWLVDSIKKNTSCYLALTSIGLSAIVNVSACIMLLQGNWTPKPLNFTGLFDFSNPIILSISPDALGLFMGVVAGVLGFLIAIFSLEYMEDDKHLSSYWFFFQLFLGGMLLLVFAEISSSFT